MSITCDQDNCSTEGRRNTISKAEHAEHEVQMSGWLHLGQVSARSSAAAAGPQHHRGPTWRHSHIHPQLTSPCTPCPSHSPTFPPAGTLAIAPWPPLAHRTAEHSKFHARPTVGAKLLQVQHSYPAQHKQQRSASKEPAEPSPGPVGCPQPAISAPSTGQAAQHPEGNRPRSPTRDQAASPSPTQGSDTLLGLPAPCPLPGPWGRVPSAGTADGSHPRLPKISVQLLTVLLSDWPWCLPAGLEKYFYN